MKKLLPVFALLCVVAVACGASEEEKAKAQDEAEQKVNEIIQELEASAEETPEPVAPDTMMVDSTAMDTNQAAAADSAQ